MRIQYYWLLSNTEKGTVIGFDAHGAIFSLLQANRALQPAASVKEAVRAGIAAQDGVMPPTSVSANSGGHNLFSANIYGNGAAETIERHRSTGFLEISPVPMDHAGDYRALLA